jgi:hypothetical protein
MPYCSLCQVEQSERERVAYGSRCEDCWSKDARAFGDSATYTARCTDAVPYPRSALPRRMRSIVLSGRADRRRR